MKRVLSVILCALLVASLAGCSFGKTASPEQIISALQSSVQSSNESSGGTESNAPQGEAEYEITYNEARLFENSIGTVWLQGIVEVTNTGSCDLYLDDGKFDLEDESGSLLDTIDYIEVCPQVISPGEKAYYYTNSIMDSIKATDTIKIAPKVDAQESTVAKILLPSSDEKLKADDYSDLEMTGRIENTTSETLSFVSLGVVLFDKDDHPIAVLDSSITDDIKPGEKASFKAYQYGLPEDVTVDSVARFEVFAFENQYQF